MSVARDERVKAKIKKTKATDRLHGADEQRTKLKQRMTL